MNRSVSYGGGEAGKAKSARAGVLGCSFVGELL